MTRSKVFKSGNSQAARIPQELALPYGEEIVRRGHELVITPVRKQDARAIFDALTAFEGTVEREQPETQEREPIL